MQSIRIENWELSYLENRCVEEEKFSPVTGTEVKRRLVSLKARVPESFEVTLMRENLLPDLY